MESWLTPPPTHCKLDSGMAGLSFATLPVVLSFQHLLFTQQTHRKHAIAAFLDDHDDSSNADDSVRRTGTGRSPARKIYPSIPSEGSRVADEATLVPTATALQACCYCRHAHSCSRYPPTCVLLPCWPRMSYLMRGSNLRDSKHASCVPNMVGVALRLQRRPAFGYAITNPTFTIIYSFKSTTSCYTQECASVCFSE
ncbi:unnamed protein product [Ectocarpus fasciculatus]